MEVVLITHALLGDWPGLSEKTKTISLLVAALQPHLFRVQVVVGGGAWGRRWAP